LGAKGILFAGKEGGALTAERKVQAEIRLELPKHGCTCWRVNVGQAWTGDEVVLLPNGDAVIRNARPFNTGLAPGFSDLFGFVHGTGRFIAIECKSPHGKPTSKQEHFLEFIKNNGGLAGIARSVEDAVRIINGGGNN
jgi:hypothetical protein